MDTQSYFYAACIALAVTLFVLYHIIRYAHSTEEQLKNQDRQLKLLIKIAEKHGVSEEDIKECIYGTKKI